MLNPTQPKTVLTLPDDFEIVMQRSFDATPETLFEIWTQPEHVRNWYGVRGTTVKICDIDLRVGGAWRWVLTRPPSMEIAFSGVFLEINRPRSFRRTEKFEGVSDNECIVTVGFNPQDGQTMLTMSMRFDSKEERDECLKSGMELGVDECMTNIDAIVTAMKGASLRSDSQL
jgi:uncharacterized protein YndB with AHSA1/START domain